MGCDTSVGHAMMVFHTESWRSLSVVESSRIREAKFLRQVEAQEQELR